MGALALEVTSERMHPTPSQDLEISTPSVFLIDYVIDFQSFQ